MRVVVLTSCTGQKSVEDDHALTQADFAKGAAHVGRRERELADKLTPAERLYTGQQHVRLMRGVSAARTSGANLTLDVYVLSAGYGVVPGDRKLAPYEVTFKGMKPAALREWADSLGVPAAARKLLVKPFDLALILLGDDYLAACDFDGKVKLGGPTLLFCGANTANRLPKNEHLRTVTLGNRDAKRFSCGLVALKGDLASRLLTRIAADPTIVTAVTRAGMDVLGLLETGAPAATFGRSKARANPDVDRVIDIPDAWWSKPHREKLRYFIPEWDDLVDREYDFKTDTHSGGSGDWSNEVYAHQLYPEPNYDGILISKVVAEKSKTKKERINRLGVHRFLRIPRNFPVMGDCGAFGYINTENPPYTTPEILDYYTRLDFDYGVSIDHLIVTATEASKRHRYQLTIDNAAAFLREHRARGLPWTPIGAVQGWDAKSYAEAARQVAAMGYDYIGLGGLVRTPTEEVLRVLSEVRDRLPGKVKIHLFGLARIRSMKEFADLGVRSADSASLLRRAWMGTDRNYLTLDGAFYTAIRVPEGGKSFRAKRMVSEGRASETEVVRLDRASVVALEAFDRDELSVERVLDVLEHYDRLITPDRPPTRELLRATLEARPWRDCPCAICRRDGIHVVIFRGNNRNRRRGFHNTFAFYRLLQRSLAGEQIAFRRAGDPTSKQLGLFESEPELQDAV